MTSSRMPRIRPAGAVIGLPPQRRDQAQRTPRPAAAAATRSSCSCARRVSAPPGRSAAIHHHHSALLLLVVCGHSGIGRFTAIANHYPAQQVVRGGLGTVTVPLEAQQSCEVPRRCCSGRSPP